MTDYKYGSLRTGSEAPQTTTAHSLTAGGSFIGLGCLTNRAAQTRRRPYPWRASSAASVCSIKPQSHDPCAQTHGMPCRSLRRIGLRTTNSHGRSAFLYGLRAQWSSLKPASDQCTDIGCPGTSPRAPERMLHDGSRGACSEGSPSFYPGHPLFSPQLSTRRLLAGQNQITP